MFHSQIQPRALAVTAAALFTLTLCAAPSFASQDAGPPIVPATATATDDDRDRDRCSIARVGDQYVACDNLTGNGVPAPAWVPER